MALIFDQNTEQSNLLFPICRWAYPFRSIAFIFRHECDVPIECPKNVIYVKFEQSFHKMKLETFGMMVTRFA
jgi:hypothetical protein